MSMAKNKNNEKERGENKERCLEPAEYDNSSILYLHVLGRPWNPWFPCELGTFRSSKPV